MELDQLRALIAAVEHGSMKSASQATGVPRARLRAQVEALERELDVSLLVRTHRGVEATPAALAFIERGRSLLAQAEDLMRSTSRQYHSTIGEIVIRVPPGPPPLALHLLLTAVSRKYPDIALHLDTPQDPFDPRGPAPDVIVHFGEPVTAGQYRTLVFRRFRYALLASRGYLDAHGRPGQLTDLAGHRMLEWTPHGIASHGRLPLCDGGEHPFRPFFVSNNVYLVRALAAQEHGIALMPLGGRIGSPAFHEDPLEHVLPEIVGRDENVRALIPADTADSARTRAIVDVLRAVGKWQPAPAAE